MRVQSEYEVESLFLDRLQEMDYNFRKSCYSNCSADCNYIISINQQSQHL